MAGAGMLSEKVAADVDTGMFTWFDERLEPVNKNVNASLQSMVQTCRWFTSMRAKTILSTWLTFI